MKKWIYAVALLTLTAGAAGAQDTGQSCAPRAQVLEKLSATYGETRQVSGLGQGDALVELFASNQTGTWTLTVTLPNGITCLMAAGEAFEALIEPTGFPT